jgi:hypothetical protein
LNTYATPVAAIRSISRTSRETGQKPCTKHRPIAVAFACNLILPLLLHER